MKTLAEETLESLSNNGAIAKHLDGYQTRHEQQQLAKTIANTLDSQNILIAEAGTGVGKTLAYLIPAINSGKKIIISTGTKNLQDQLFHRDLPMVRDALGISVKVALLKGRSNYLCHQRLEHNALDGRFTSREMISQFHDIKKHSRLTRSGDKSEISTVAEDAHVWSMATSTADNCIGQDCDFFQDCFVVKARRAALAADIVVINHHLFFADLALKDEGFGEILPNVEAIIFDEAHQLPEVARTFFGTQVGSRQLNDICREAKAEVLTFATDMKQLSQTADRCEVAIQKLRLSFGVDAVKKPWHEIQDKKNVNEAVERMHDELQIFIEQLKVAAPRSKNMANIYERAAEAAEKFGQLTGATPSDQIHWFETYTKSFQINLSPIDVAKYFSALISKGNQSWIFTSATLAVKGSFTHYQHQMGLEDAQTLLLDSPFPYKQNALMYVPPELPQPSHEDYFQRLFDLAIDVINDIKGRTFFLFTSYRAMNKAQEYLAEKLDFPILVQGTKPKSLLLKEFTEHGNAVLLGTSSFWEGVDVRGDALSCVIIDKLPFASPGDPIVKAIEQSIKKSGKAPFFEYLLPNAVISLKQGAGRLIRDYNDTGVLIIADKRLLQKGYGKIFLDSLPRMLRTTKLDVVKRFIGKTILNNKSDASGAIVNEQPASESA